jgi:hypothetical protein
VKGQSHRWYAPALDREREHTQLERIATKILKEAHRRKKPPRPVPRARARINITTATTIVRFAAITAKRVGALNIIKRRESHD